MYTWHALPDGWYEEMNYAMFLKERQKQIVKVIQEGFLKLKEHVQKS